MTVADFGGRPRRFAGLLTALVFMPLKELRLAFGNISVFLIWKMGIHGDEAVSEKETSICLITSQRRKVVNARFRWKNWRVKRRSDG